MIIATWNVNSLRVRKERLLAWLVRAAPDVVCLQELKLTEDLFPYEELSNAGYHAAVLGQPTYNGVAILSREPATDVVTGMDDDAEDEQARLIAADVRGVRVISAYFPNGGEVGSEKWTYKLTWMSRLQAQLARHGTLDQPLALCGDFNVAPADLDVARPDEWRDSALCHPDARSALAAIQALGLVDVYRRLEPDTAAYSWWDYRQLAFPKGNGLRIDHLYCSAPLAKRVVQVGIERDERKGEKPSDHVPVWGRFER